MGVASLCNYNYEFTCRDSSTCKQCALPDIFFVIIINIKHNKWCMFGRELPFSFLFCTWAIYKNTSHIGYIPVACISHPLSLIQSWLIKMMLKVLSLLPLTIVHWLLKCQLYCHKYTFHFYSFYATLIYPCPLPVLFVGYKSERGMTQIASCRCY